MAISRNKKVAFISAVAIALLLVGIGIVAIVSSLSQRNTNSSDYSAIKKEVESVQDAYGELEAQGERYIGSVELAKEGSVVDDARLNAFQAARNEIGSKLAALKERDISDPTIKESVSNFADDTSRAANEFMALSFAASTYSTCIVAPIGLPNAPEDFESDKLDLTNCIDTAKQLSTVDSASGKEYGGAIQKKAEKQLSYYDDIQRLGDFTSDENLREYLDISDKAETDGSSSLGATQPRQVITAQNEAVDAYNEAYNKLIGQIDKNVQFESSNE